MEKYIVIKELPDAHVGTEVIWDEYDNNFYYEKSCYVSPHSRNYLSAGQVTQSPEYFCKAEEYPEYYTYHFPVYSRGEIIKLIKECFPNKIISNELISREMKIFEDKLRELGKYNAEKIIKK